VIYKLKQLYTVYTLENINYVYTRDNSNNNNSNNNNSNSNNINNNNNNNNNNHYHMLFQSQTPCGLNHELDNNYRVIRFETHVFMDSDA